ncbi:PREDICTED: kinesin-like protein KIF15 isoform X3 [Nicrophorus vespilloides]|uniref:Kinesin-like protein KIF15 isoform X3 n=1 Tax=Nicrophorus vespilloides TaxID=110193 RepID=A0ABM1N7I0_NICVS|nr:PREDICTED: kinesin-like protein KIF15 isoform X3 [Nicrophorus vespilloides]
MEPNKSAKSAVKVNKNSKMEDKQDAINVVVRVRPAVKGHQNEGSKEYWKPVNNTLHFLPESGEVPQNIEYTFGNIYGAENSNKDVYNSVKPIVKSAVNGINGTVIAYGESSSGKTYTNMGDHKDKGIIPLAIEDIFRLIKSDTRRKYLLRSSYIEIYNDKINDLLNKAQCDLKIRENISGTLTVDNCVEQIVRSSDEMMDVIIKGNQNRQVFNTPLNNQSSRSHVIFKIVIESIPNDALSEDDDVLVQVSHLHFVDMAGSEKSVETNTGARLRESRHINRSLSILTRIIRLLVDNYSHINFKDAALTHLLSNSLGGNCRTLIIATIATTSLDNTESTLMFAQAAKKIKIKPRLNQVLTTEAIINQLKHKERKLISQLKFERNKKITYHVNQPLKNKIVKDLEHDIKNIQLKYVRRDTKASTSHGARNRAGPSTAPVLPDELQDEAVGHELMDISDIATTFNVLKHHMNLNDSRMNVELNKPGRKYESKGVVIDAYPKDTSEPGRTKKKEIKRALGDTMAKLEFNNYDMEISIESIVSLYKMRELEWSYPKGRLTSKPEFLEFTLGEPFLKKTKSVKKPCEDVKVSRKFKIREDRLCLEAKLAILKEKNKTIMEENADMKFRESLWKSKIFGSSQKPSGSSDDSNIKPEKRTSRSHASNKRTTMVRSLSLPNMHNGLLKFNEEIRKEDKNRYLSLQSLNDVQPPKYDSLVKTNTTLQTNIVHTGTVRKLKEKNNMLKNHVLALQIQNQKLVKDHTAQVNSMNENHAIQVTSYENMLKEMTGYNDNVENEHSTHKRHHNTKGNDNSKKLSNANIIINKMKEQLKLMQEKLNSNEIDKQIELEKMKNHYTAQLASLQLNIVNKDCKDRIEMKGFKTKLLEREREVASLMLRINEQNEKSEQILKYYELKIKNLEKSNSDFSEEVTVLQMKLDSAVQINHIKQLEADLGALQVQLQKSKKVSNDALLEVTRLQGLLDTSQSDLEAASCSHENMQLELEQEISVLKAQLETAKKERAEAVEDAKSAQELYEITMRNLDAASEYSENIQLEYNKELNTLKSEIDEAVEGKRKVAIELRKARQEHEKASAERDEKIRDMQGSLEKNNAEIVGIKKKLAEKEEAIQKTKTDLTQEYTRKVKEYENDIKKGEDLIALKDTQVHDLTTTLKKAANKVVSLEKKLQESNNNTEEILNEGSIQFQQVEEELKNKQKQLEAAEKVIENMRNNHVAKIRYLQEEFNEREEMYNREFRTLNEELIDMRENFRDREDSLNEQILSKDEEIKTLKDKIKEEQEDEEDDVNNYNGNDDNNDDDDHDNNGGDGNMGNGSMQTGAQEENEPTDQKTCECNDEKRDLQNQLYETRNKLYDVERSNDELEQSFKYLYDIQRTEVITKDQEIISLTDKVSQYERTLISSQLEVTDTRNSVDITANQYESKINELKAIYKKEEDDIKYIENTNLIKNHKEQIEIYEKKLKSVNLHNDRMMLENSEQVKLLENQVEQLQSELTTAYNEHANQIENVRAMHSVEMSALMQANDQKDSLKISKLKESYESKLKDNNCEIVSLKKKLQELCEKNESSKKVHTITQKDLANALTAAEAMLKESNSQYQQLVDNHANQIDNLTESHQSITENNLKNEGQAKEYLMKNQELQTKVLNLNVQVDTVSRTYEDMNNQHLTDITKINDDHNAMITSLENIRSQKEKEYNEVSEMLEAERKETLKLKEELSNALETIAILKKNNITDEQKKKDEQYEFELEVLNSTIVNIKNNNEQQKKIIKDMEKDLENKNKVIEEIKIINTNMEKRLSGMLEEMSSNNDEEGKVVNSNQEEQFNIQDDEDNFDEMDTELPSAPAEETPPQENVASDVDPKTETSCASCKNTIAELKCMVFKISQHNSKLIDNCHRLRNKNQSLQVKINDMRRILDKAKIHADSMKKSDDSEKRKNSKPDDAMSVTNTDAQILKAKLDTEYANAEKLNKKIMELHNAQKLYRTHLKQQTTDARWEEVNVSKAFQEGVKERRQSLHDQRRHINACDKCVQRLYEIENYRKEGKKLTQLNQLLNEKYNDLESKLTDVEDSDALELQAQFNCTEVLLRNLNRFITKGADTCEQCTTLLNFLYKKILALSKIYDNNTYWYFKAETDSQTIDEVLKVVDRFQPKLGNDLANEGMVILESVKNKLQRAKNVLCNKRRYIQNFLEILKKDINILQQILSFPADKRCVFYESNKNVALLLLQIKKRLSTSLRYLDETNVEEKERTRFKINKMDEYITDIEDQLVRDMPCSVNVMTYNQLALKYVSLKALIRLRLDRHDDLQDIQDYLMPHDESLYSVDTINQNVAEAARMTAAAGAFAYVRGGSFGLPTSTIVRPASSTIVREAPCTIVREDTSNSMQDGTSTFTFCDISDTAVSQPDASSTLTLRGFSNFESSASTVTDPEPIIEAPASPVFIAPLDVASSTDADPTKPKSDDPNIAQVNNKYYITDDEVYG